jgi:AdoMet-dependent heme synthase
MVWLATNACNARCVHCSSDALECRPHELDTDEAMRLFDELAAFGVLDVAVSGGEPLVRRDLFDVMAHARGAGIRLGVGSNGSTVTTDVVRRMRELEIDRLQISIDGTPATHDRARRWQGLYEKSVTAIRRGIEGGLNVHVCFTVHALNHHEIAEVIAACVEWGVRRFNLSRFVPTGRGDRALDLPASEWRAMMTQVERFRVELAGTLEITTHLAQLVLLDRSLDDCAGFIGCQAGLGQGCVDSEGNVLPCVMVPIVAGNIRERPFAEIWEQSPVLRTLRDRTTLQGACGTCPDREKCGGCRGVAYAYTGEVTAADPRCWR